MSVNRKYETRIKIQVDRRQRQRRKPMIALASSVCGLKSSLQIRIDDAQRYDHTHTPTDIKTHTFHFDGPWIAILKKKMVLIAKD